MKEKTPGSGVYPQAIANGNQSRKIANALACHAPNTQAQAAIAVMQ